MPDQLLAGVSFACSSCEAQVSLSGQSHSVFAAGLGAYQKLEQLAKPSS